MNPLIVLSALVAVSQASYIAPYSYGAYPYAAGAYAAYPGAYAAAPIAAKAYAAPIAAAPVAYAAPYAYPSSQFQAQDEFGNVNYGYANINSAKQEVGNAYGGVVGSYSYVDADGKLQRTEYVADALGFRVKATNLPVAPVFEGKAPVFEGKAPVFDLEAPVFDGVAPEPVVDTAEVAAAKAEFQAAFEEAKARSARSTPADTDVLEKAEVDLKIKPLTYATAAFPYAAGAYPYTTYNAGLYGAYPYAAAYGYAAPLAYRGYPYLY